MKLSFFQFIFSLAIISTDLITPVAVFANYGNSLSEISLNVNEEKTDTAFFSSISMPQYHVKRNYTIPLSFKSVLFNNIELQDRLILSISPNGDTLRPGDTVFIEPGVRNSFLRITNLKGSPEKPIVVINGPGKVIIHNEDKGGGMAFRNCEYIHFTGTGDKRTNYGILIDTAYIGATGLGIEELSNHFEIDHVEICNTGFAGLMVKTDPSCDSTTWQSHFEMQDIRIHHNYIHNTRGEGMYIGFSKPGLYEKKCSAFPIKVSAHRIKNLKIYNNVVTKTGFDGIQIGCATENIEVYNNEISYFGQRCDKDGKYYGMTGIVVGGGSSGAYYKNRITDGMGSAFQIFGEGDIYLFDNMIIRAGQAAYCSEIEVSPSSIFGDDRTEHNGYSVFIFNNTIIDPPGKAIDFRNLNHKKNIIVNNLIVNQTANNLSASENAGKIIVKEINETAVEGNIILTNDIKKNITNNLDELFRNRKSDDYRLTKAGQTKLKGSSYKSAKVDKLKVEGIEHIKIGKVVGIQ